MDMYHDGHDHGSGSGSGNGTASCPMIMYFHGGHCERILWESWVASTVVEFVFSALAFFLISFFYEGLKWIREYLKRQELRRNQHAVELQIKNANNCHTTTNANGPTCSNVNLSEIREKTFLEHILSRPHLVQTSINVIQVVISYMLMLVFMTFNYWLCLAVILGLGLGYFFFGWIRLDAYEHECCQ